MTEQVAQWIYEHECSGKDCGNLLPEIAWEELEDKEGYLEDADTILALIKEAGYVQLDKDQTLPEIQDIASAKAAKSKTKNQWFVDGQAMAYGKVYQAGWRRVVLEVKGGS